jgi:hypothetical protein
VVEEAHIHSTLRTFPNQDLTNLTELELAVGEAGELALLELDLGTRTFEIKTCADLFAGLVNGIPDLGHIGFKGGVK